MLKKQYLKTRPICKVTFRIHKTAAQSASGIALVGDFNGWDTQATPMTALKNGEFTAVLELDTGMSEYQFRYLYDGSRWENDWEADGYAVNGVDGENSIVRV
ncbi:isoamylase early set domain-containing protein [Thiothrix lacustris]|jgi:1,4-alpha-glucan branching enzyme|uniref:Isoamylase early set domain-containing protein n=1 Tax=Thiothrix lacustris TaxID=525917 RepID=A0ABY9MNL7_9GAMM|nr:isoamylase early set domain-containing protein [Thiothrix lacustris]WML90244.1 isoamylase early set domain-containing protein [Thiothrix lacustris]